MTASPAPFACVGCGETYQPHWRAEASPFGLCRTCHDQQGDRCIWPGHPAHDNPCSYGPSEQPGDPCRYCGDPYPPGSKPCAACWVDVAELGLAGLKALFAGDATFDLVPRTS